MKNAKNYKIMPNIFFWEEIFSTFQKIDQLSNYFTGLKQEPNNEVLLPLFHILLIKFKLFIFYPAISIISAYYKSNYYTVQRPCHILGWIVFIKP